MKRRLLILTAGLAVLVCAFVAWRRYVEFIPPDETPTVTLPSPNAYDFYVKAGKARVHAPLNIDPVYATEVIPEAQWKTHYPIAKKEEWLRKNTAALRLLREGFKHPCRAPLHEPGEFTSYAPLRELARTLAVESRVYGEKEQWEQAAGSALDCLHLGYDISHGGILMEYLVGAAVNSIGRRVFWEAVPHLNAVEARATAQRLESILDRRISYPELLRNEKQFMLRDTSHSMRSPEWRTMNLTNATGTTRWKQLWQIYSTPRRTILNNHKDYMDAVIIEAEKPYSSTRKWPASPSDFYHQVLSTSALYSTAYFLYTREQADDALLLASLALRAYRLDNGHYPQTLTKLVPRYLKQNPLDPFGNDKALRYRPKADSYVLYSLGPDGVDDHGQEIRDPKRAGKGRREFMVQQESKGDFVAGTNY